MGGGPIYQDRPEEPQAMPNRKSEDEPKTDPEHEEDLLDEALDESFPASDPASITRHPVEKDKPS